MYCKNNPAVLTSLLSLISLWNCNQVATAAGTVTAAAEQNSGKIARIDLTATPARVTFEVKIVDPKTPVTLLVGSTNPIEVVNSQLVGALGDQKGVERIEVVEGAADKSGVKSPHQLKLSFSEPKTFELTIGDGSITIIPQYFVHGTNASTTIDCKLLLSNASPNPLSNTRIQFSGGGLKLPETQVDLAVRGECLVAAQFVSKDDILSDNIPAPLPLAYWAKSSDFRKNSAKAVLQFPLKGNWPESLTLPGWIHYSYLSEKLGDFQYPVASTAAQQAKAYKDAIEEEFHSFSDIKPPAEFGPVELKSVVENAISDTDKWPRIDYCEFTDFSSTDTSGKPVWIRLDDRNVDVKNWDISFDNNKSPKNPVVTVPVMKSTGLVMPPGKETAKDLKELHDLLDTLTIREIPKTVRPFVQDAPAIRENPKGAQMKKTILPIVQLLNTVGTLLNSPKPTIYTLEPRIQLLNAQLMVLVQSGASEDAVKLSRSKLESAKKAAAAIVESYNAIVLSFPN